VAVRTANYKCRQLLTEVGKKVGKLPMKVGSLPTFIIRF
jgi:hypothetical protein